MGQCESCFRGCFGYGRRKYMRTHYSERDFSIEFENLMEEDEPESQMQKPLTDSEKALLTARKYDAIVQEQHKLDAHLDQQIARQEEEIRAEEEAFYEAKREASRIARLQKERLAKPKLPVKKSWLGDNEDDWQVAGGDDDFEMFLEGVKARSLASRERLGSGDGQSTSSSQTKDKSHDASSIEMEWDHRGDVTTPIETTPTTNAELSTAALRKEVYGTDQSSEKRHLLQSDTLSSYSISR